MASAHTVLTNLDEEAGEGFPGEKDIESACLLLLEEMRKERSSEEGFELSLSLVSNEEIQELNLTYRDKDAPTDVLSFPLFTVEESSDNVEFFPVYRGARPVGDVVISHEICRAQAAEIGHSVQDEFLRLLVHGVLHLFGYDHEISPEEEERMKKREDELLALLGASGL